MPLLQRLLCLILLVVLSGVTQGSDILKERRWAEQLKDSLVAGEPVWLKVNGREIFSIYTPAGHEKRRGGVILLHGRGAHPDWPEVINPLRLGLPEAGWATLSVQLPILDGETDTQRYLPLFPESFDRINAAIVYLQNQGMLNITLVGHSLGAAMGAAYLATERPETKAIRAFVGIGMGQYPQDPTAPAHTPASLRKITIPVLDLYGDLDLQGVIAAAEARATAAKAVGNGDFRQRRAPGADHFFTGLDTTLVSWVSGWLTKNAPAVQVQTEDIGKTPMLEGETSARP
jgi:pimeloyl-ACP methyl ester carboxylesterase